MNDKLTDSGIWQIAREWFDNNDDYASLVAFARRIAEIAVLHSDAAFVHIDAQQAEIQRLNALLDNAVAQREP